MSRYRQVDFTDQLLADGSVHRRFTDGVEEWRRRGPGELVYWRSNQGVEGTDELLGRRIIKRQYTTGQVMYGRDLGYGRTAWGNGTITTNRTSFGGRMGAILAAVGAGALLGAVVAPPLSMTLAEEEALRQQRAAAQQSSSSDSGTGDWSDGDGGSDDDFG